MKHLVIILLSIAFAFSAKAQANRYYYENAIYRDDIKSVKLFREGFELSSPVMELNEDIRLVLKFDDLSNQIKNYYYTIIHCDHNWNESFLPQNDYLEGFTENPLNDYVRSINTTFPYINYQLGIPNEDMRFKISGNYILLVYENMDKENLVLARRFYVTENAVDIAGNVRRPTSDSNRGQNQEVNFVINHPNLKIDNPFEDVKVVIMQNWRWDNAIRNLKPLFVKNNQLDYSNMREAIFKAGNEFRYFDIRSRRVNGEGVRDISFHRPYFHVTLRTDEVRSNKPYFFYKEMDGRYAVESRERVQDYDTECDYVFVHFNLKLNAPLLGGTVNVFGELSNWNANKSNEMTWNFEKSCYELSLLLKQGYYNYMYVYVPEGALIADHVNLEGSFWETRNEYQIFVYYKEFSGRYDRLIAFNQLYSNP